MNAIVSMENLTSSPNRLDRTRVHRLPSFSRESLQNAKNSFARTAVDGKDLIFIDMAPRGFVQKLSSGSPFPKPCFTGLLVTDRVIYDGSTWEGDSFLPGLYKRFIPLRMIHDITISEWFGGKKRLLVNGISLFVQNSRAFTGVEDAVFLDWCAKQLSALASKVRDMTTTLKDIVLSYESFLTSESSFLGGGDVYYAGHIPSAYVERAKQACLKLDSADEEILFFYNDSGKGEGGVVFTG
ncbi:MAG: hypothetical protein AB2L20_21105 [Mangrovibacterium sp.]